MDMHKIGIFRNLLITAFTIIILVMTLPMFKNITDMAIQISMFYCIEMVGL